MVVWPERLSANERFLLAVGVLVVGLVAGFVVGRVIRRVLVAAGVGDAVEGTTFERTARSLGTSTIGIFAGLSAWFVYGLGVILALQVAELLPRGDFWTRATGSIPNVFLAVLVLGIGFVVADKVELVVSEWLRGVKLPEVGLIPRAVRYTIIYLAVLVALGQVGVATGALLIMLGVYALAVITLTAVALRDLLPAAAAGVYLLLTQPFGIGDTVVVGDHRGVVQEVSVLVTSIEDDDHEYILPNHLVLREGVVRVRNG